MKLPSAQLAEIEKKWKANIAYAPTAMECRAYRQGIMDAICYWRKYMRDK